MRVQFFFYFLFVFPSVHTIYGQFTEVAESIGILMPPPPRIGSSAGVTFFDFNKDGWDDLYVCGGNLQDRLYKNNGNGTFTDITSIAGLEETASLLTVAAKSADFNRDGWPDLFVVVRNRFIRNLLYINQGNGTFKEKSILAGITHASESTDAVILDVNLDGWPDVYVTNYVERNEFLYEEGIHVGFKLECLPNYLYINNAGESFTEQALAFNVADSGCGLAVMSMDIDRDGDQDILLANDFGRFEQPNRLFINQYPETTFLEQGKDWGLNDGFCAMGWGHGDYNNDGLTDLYVTNIGKNFLYTRNSLFESFSDRSIESGSDNTYETTGYSGSWGTVMWDADHDGWDDLFVANAYITEVPFLLTPFSNADRFFRNNQDGTFRDDTFLWKMGFDGRSKGAAISDFDGDGDMDLAVGIESGPQNGKVLFYRNDFTNGNWIKFFLSSHKSLDQALGAEMIIYAAGFAHSRLLTAGSSSVSQHSHFLHLGLGGAEKIDSVIIFWPAGEQQKIGVLSVNKQYFIEKDSLPLIMGCLDSLAENFQPEAQISFGCYKPLAGCKDPTSPYFDWQATEDSGYCGPPLSANDKTNNLPFFPNPATENMIVREEGALFNSTGQFIEIWKTGHQLIGKMSKGIYFYKTSSGTYKLILK